MPIELVKLDTPPSSSDEHIQADYIELLCLVNAEHEISKADIIDRLQEGTDLDLNLAEAVEGDDAEPAIKNDRVTQKVEDWFRQLLFRSSACGEFYPFEIIAGGSVLRRKEVLTLKHKHYVYLLLCSCLRHISKSDQSQFTASFEFLSAAALRRYLPDRAEVHVFGSNPLHGNDAHYTGRKVDKIKQLAADICDASYCEDDEFKTGDTGDEGLDLVAWISLDDGAPGFLVLLGQCACTENWVNKQYTSGYDNWRSFIRFTVRPSNMVFIPFCYRSADGAWYQRGKISNSIVVDRLRILKLLHDQEEPLDKLPYELVEGALNYTEPYV